MMRGAPPLAWGLCGLTLLLAVGTFAVGIAVPDASGPEELGPPRVGAERADQEVGTAVLIVQTLVLCAFALVGGVVAARRPRNPIGWLCGVAALSLALLGFTGLIYWWVAFGRPDYPHWVDVAAWAQTWVWIPALVPISTLVPLLFPTGAPPGPRWRFVGYTSLTAAGVCIVSTALQPGKLREGDFTWVENPFAVDVPALTAVSEISAAVMLLMAPAAVASLVVRYRRSRGIERLQLRWVLAGGCLLISAFVFGASIGPLLDEAVGYALLLVGLLAVAASIAVAMLRYRLYDIDVVINRALVYGVLTATLVATYLAVVLLAQLLLGGLTGDSSLAVAASTLAVAAMFRPARARIQEGVDRRFYRRRYDAQRTLEAFSIYVRDEVALDAVAAELRSVTQEAMQPVHVSLWLAPGTRGP